MENKIAVSAVMLMLLFSAGIAGAQQQSQADAKPLTNERIVSLVKSGIDDDIIISLISRSPASFDASLTALSDLHEAGVSNAVINAIKRRTPTPTPPPPAKPEQNKTLTNAGIVSLSQAGLSDANIISVIKKSRVNFDLGAEGAAGLTKAGVTNAVIDAMKLKSEANNKPAIPAKGKTWFDVSLSYLSVPVKFSYPEFTQQITVDAYGNLLYVGNDSTRGRSKSFRQGGIGLRFAKMNSFSDTVSAGIEWGFTFAAGEEAFSFSVGQTVGGSTQTVHYPNSLLNINGTLYGPVSTKAKIKSGIVPLFAKVDYKMKGNKIWDSFSVGTGLGAYFILTTLEITQNSWDNYNVRTQNKDTIAVLGVTPALEISGGGRIKVSEDIHFTVSGLVGYSAKAKFLGSSYYYSYGYREHTQQGSNYKEGIETGGLSYGGKASLSFMF